MLLFALCQFLMKDAQMMASATSYMAKTWKY